MAGKKRKPAIKVKEQTPSEIRLETDLLAAWMETGQLLGPDVKGMLFVRDTRANTGVAQDPDDPPPQPDMDGRRLVMVIGVLSLPKDADLPGEHQFVVMGLDFPDTIRLNLMKDQRVDLSKDRRVMGARMDQLLLESIWRA